MTPVHRNYRRTNKFVTNRTCRKNCYCSILRHSIEGNIQELASWIVDRTDIGLREVQIKDWKREDESSYKIGLTQIVVKPLLVNLCVKICPSWRLHSSNGWIEWLQCQETRADITTMSSNLVKESQKHFWGRNWPPYVKAGPVHQQH